MAAQGPRCSGREGLAGTAKLTAISYTMQVLLFCVINWLGFPPVTRHPTSCRARSAPIIESSIGVSGIGPPRIRMLRFLINILCNIYAIFAGLIIYCGQPGCEAMLRA